MHEIYLAARYSRRSEMEVYADILQGLDGHRVTAQWVYGNEEGKTKENIALMDEADVRRASTVVLFTEPTGTLVRGGGRFVEFGLGRGLGKKLYVVGGNEMIFCYWPEVVRLETFNQLRLALNPGAVLINGYQMVKVPLSSIPSADRNPNENWPGMPYA